MAAFAVDPIVILHASGSWLQSLRQFFIVQPAEFESEHEAGKNRTIQIQSDEGSAKPA